MLLTSGTIGDHGFAVADGTPWIRARRAVGLRRRAAQRADSRGAASRRTRCRGDEGSTRGGLASTLHEMAAKAAVTIVLDERAVPVTDEARAVSELLGIDPLNVANEGKAIIGVRPWAADAVLAALRAHPRGRRAAVIGRAVEGGRRLFSIRASAAGCSWSQRANLCHAYVEYTSASHRRSVFRPRTRPAPAAAFRGGARLASRSVSPPRMRSKVKTKWYCGVACPSCATHSPRFTRSAGPRDDWSIVACATPTTRTVELLRSHEPDLVILAGYLWLLTQPMLSAFENRIVNVHHADLRLRTASGAVRYPGLRAVRDAILAGEAETRCTAPRHRDARRRADPRRSAAFRCRRSPRGRGPRP